MDLPIVQPIGVIDQDLTLVIYLCHNADVPARRFAVSLDYQHCAGGGFLATPETAGGALPPSPGVAPQGNSGNHSSVGHALQRTVRCHDLRPHAGIGRLRSGH